MKKTLIALALTAGASLSVMAQDIVDTAVKAGNFKTLVAAVQAAGLVDTLKGPGPFTVFAPTDEAFAKIPKATLDGLLADSVVARLTVSSLPPLPFAPPLAAPAAVPVASAVVTAPATAPVATQVPPRPPVPAPRRDRE